VIEVHPGMNRGLLDGLELTHRHPADRH
jgi:hypothetical protein